MSLSFRALGISLGLALLSFAGFAQQPAAPATQTQPAEEYRLGGNYRIETVDGTSFTGELVSLSLNNLEFETKELGHITLSRDKIKRSVSMDAPTNHRPGFYDIGNGVRLFNAPTARGLRKGEGSIQDTYLVFVGGEYGITNNFSIGATLSLVPGVPLDQQLLILSPKVTAPISEKLHAAVGLIYANIPFDGNNSGSAGIGYGSLTYGTAEDNLTLGVGYGFTQGEIGRTPVFQLGGQKRISRRTSLVSENYIIAHAEAGMGGLYGLRFHWPRTSLGLGAVYTLSYPTTETVFDYDPFTGTYGAPRQQRVPSKFFTSYVLPVFIDFAFRFGTGTK